MITFSIFIAIFAFRQKLADDITQRVSSVGTQFEIAEDKYAQARKGLSERSAVAEEEIAAMTLLYSDVEQELTFMQNTLFVSKEENNSLEETLQAVKKRREQLGTMERLNVLVKGEKDIQNGVQTFDKCIEAINYNGDPGTVATQLRECVNGLIIVNSLATSIQTQSNLVCNDKATPQEYLEQVEKTYNLLAAFYENVHIKEYPVAVAKENEYKAEKTVLQNYAPWSECYTDILTKTLETL
ncbi:MAG: hypothetical protein QY314_04300 [Candidatus Dojkabacteria bacterium]|nr:MAG: hypothetical protein QY314_04300 [Candidatus Dojkabacteria bacterium]